MAMETEGQEEVRIIEEWHGLDRVTRKRRWDLLDSKRRKVLLDAYGPSLFIQEFRA
jgi:hypothetical protein